jgi:hypothetical protein
VLHPSRRRLTRRDAIFNHPDSSTQTCDRRHHHRSDRRQASSITPERFERGAWNGALPSGSYLGPRRHPLRHKPACRCAVCPSPVMPSTSRLGWHSKAIPLCKEEPHALTQREVPVEGLGNLLTLRSFGFHPKREIVAAPK